MRELHDFKWLHAVEREQPLDLTHQAAELQRRYGDIRRSRHGAVLSARG